MTVKYCKRVWEFFAANVELEPKPSDQCTSDHVHVDDGYMNFDHDRGQRTSQVSRRLLKSLHFKTLNDGRFAATPSHGPKRARTDEAQSSAASSDQHPPPPPQPENEPVRAQWMEVPTPDWCSDLFILVYQA